MGHPRFVYSLGAPYKRNKEIVSANAHKVDDAIMFGAVLLSKRQAVTSHFRDCVGAIFSTRLLLIQTNPEAMGKVFRFV